MDKVCLYFILLLLNIKARGQGIALICPKDFVVKGQAWYAEAKFKITKLSISREDNNFRLAKALDQFAPKDYSVCAICLHLNSPVEVEMCLEHQNMKRQELTYERRTPPSDQFGTLAWNGVKNPRGLIIDMSRGDLLTTLQNIEAIQDPSLQQSETLHCPAGFKLVRFLSRERVYHGPATTPFQTKLVPCMSCSNDHQGLSFSSCVGDSRETFFGSVLMPSLYYNGICQFNMKQGSEECETNPDFLTNTQEPLCGVLLHPNQFANQIGNLNHNHLNSNCPHLEGISKFPS